MSVETDHQTPSVEGADLDVVLGCLADVLERDAEGLDPEATLAALGLESFTAVRLRRRLRDETGLDLPLTAFLGAATARTVAAGETLEDAAAGAGHEAAEDVPGEPDGADGADRGFPLTPVQAAYLVGRDPAFPLGGVATFYYQEYDRRPAGDPVADLAALGTAWNRLVCRHPMLRMVVGADARQRVLAEVDEYSIAVTDLRDRDDAGTVLAAMRAECSHQLRPTDRWPLFDIRAALLPDGRTRLFVGVDVLALDLAGWMQLMREWGRLVADPQAALPEPAGTFAEHVRHAGGPGRARRREVDAAYWARRAPELPDGPALPWTASPGELGVPHFTRHAATLDAATWAALRERAAAHGLSPTGLLLAACGLVLQRWGAPGPFSLNTTLFDRTDATGEEPGDDGEPGMRDVVGDFTTTVLVEVPDADLTAWSGFAGYAAAVNRRFWTDLDHRTVSGMEALQALHASGARPRPTDPATGLPVPVHPVVFTSGVGLSGPGPAPAAWLGTEVFGVSQTPQVLLDHIVHDEGGTLRIAWDAVDGALPDGFVPGLRDAHRLLLQRLADDESAWTNPGLGWVPSMVADGPVHPSAFPSLGPLLDDPARAAAAAAPEAPALITSDAVVTAGVLRDRAAATGQALAALGVGPGDLVAVCAEKGPAQVTALLGVLASGAGYVPVEPSWPAARVASLCEQAGLRHALVAPDVTAAFPDAVAVHTLDADGGLPAPPDPPTQRRPAPDHLAYVIFTSGSTGRPKGVAIEHRAARTTLDDLAGRFPLTAEDRVLGLSAFSFDLSVYDVFSVLGSGGAVVLPQPLRQRDPGHWLELMAAHAVTVWNTAPALLEMLVEYAELEPELTRRALAPLRLVLLSADWIPVTLPDRLRALAPRAQVVSLGGATEASIWSIFFPIGEVDPAWPSIPYGRALGGQSFQVLDERGGPCPVGVTGELFIGGAGLARGYVGDPAQTAERFAVHPVLRERLYRTGDLGRWRTDGTIEFLGRVDRQVKIRGHRIELGEIEAALHRLPGVRQVVARAVPGPDDRPRLVGHLVADDPAHPPTDDELIATLRASVPPYMVPNRFVRMDAFPITDNGKIDYKALVNPYQRANGVPAGEPAAVETAEGANPRPADPPAAQALPAGALPAGAPLDAPLCEAIARGLELRLAVAPGRLSPVAALETAATWARRLRAGLVPHGVAVRERLAPDALVELVLTADGHTDGTTALAPPPSPSPLSPPPPAAPQSSRSETAPVPVDGPDPQVERAVARVFSDLLGGPVAVDVPFFQLGASSLTLVLAHRALHAELDSTLLVVDMFARPTVRELARLITERRGGPDTPVTESVAGSAVAPGRAGARRAARARAAEVAR